MTYSFEVEYAKMQERKRLREIAKGDQREAFEQDAWRQARFLEALGYEPPQATVEEILEELTGEHNY
ncbi:hypothetical protein [Jiangella sp. DSM 45060]|uniref:hypothetical protein n=1 Tax=Jiangella sp. DSM 45060 TaxID=1798224 RepID=UPI00087CCBC2|nr:hypothetical protein [Jiangella sp. DSM 45060]SDT35661.1 hypothetical protein SAMN04515669_3693 [Jiangella sp. DSM 45060]